jgi:hypothetical protein
MQIILELFFAWTDAFLFKISETRRRIDTSAVKNFLFVWNLSSIRGIFPVYPPVDASAMGLKKINSPSESAAQAYLIYNARERRCTGCVARDISCRREAAKAVIKNESSRVMPFLERDNSRDALAGIVDNDMTTAYPSEGRGGLSILNVITDK